MATDPTAETDRRHIFLLMGQSNMAGRGEIEPGDDQPVPGIFVLDGQCGLDDPRPVHPIAWRPAAHPLHLNEPHKEQFGLGLDFAQRYRELNPHVSVGLIPCAWGGQPIDVLGPGKPLYANAVQRAQVAAEDGIVVGVLWHQGESDTASTAAAAAYGAKLRGFIASVRADINEKLMFVIGDLAQTLSTDRDEEIRANVTTVRRQLHEIASAAGNGWVSSLGLDSAADNTHFTRDALREFGRRYAEVATDLRRRSDRCPETEPAAGR